MDWDKVLTLLHIATAANDFPKMHGLRNAALAEIETEMENLIEPAPEEE